MALSTDSYKCMFYKETLLQNQVLKPQYTKHQHKHQT